jgi:hypothetical protein
LCFLKLYPAKREARRQDLRWQCEELRLDQPICDVTPERWRFAGWPGCVPLPIRPTPKSCLHPGPNVAPLG